MTDQTAQTHIPVLLEKIAEYLEVAPSTSLKLLLDCTLGGGGHSEALLNRNRNLFLLGVDRDPEAVARCTERFARFSDRVHLSVGNFADLEEHIRHIPPRLSEELSERTDFPRFDRIVADLGLSSYQLDDPERGFSFSVDSPLDMRMNRTTGRTAASLVNESSFVELKQTFVRGGVGPASGPLARAIIDARPIGGTKQLAEICRSTLRAAQRKVRKGSSSKHHPATVPFQAIRIAVNDELGSLAKFLSMAPDYLASGGRLAIISFHSLEDTLVTRAMRQWSRQPPELRKLPGAERAVRGRLLTPQAVVPDEEEIAQNPRARSARLRVFERLQNNE